LTLFYISGELFLLFLSILFVSILIFFTELLSIFNKVSFFRDFQVLIGGFILGLNIYFSFLILNISSNLTIESMKFPFIIAFIIFILYANQKIFKPIILRNEWTKEKEEDKREIIPELKLIYYFLFGIVFFLSINWIFNPMALAAYDVIILNWYEYGFLYYIIVLMSSTLISFFFIRYIFLNLESLIIKRLTLIINVIFCVLNCAAFFIIDNDITILSTLYITSLTAISVFTILFNFSYIIQQFFFPNNKKSYLGIIIFIFSFVISYAIAIIFTWTLYISLLITILILSAVYFTIFIANEIKKMHPVHIEKQHISNHNKFYGIIFLIIFSINLTTISVMTLKKNFKTGSEKNPTIMVWNIHNGIGVDGKFDLDRMVKEIKEVDPDILGLNEVDMGVMKTGFADIASYFAEKLNMHYFYGPTFFKHYGNAIFSKYPFENVETIDLPCSDKVKGEPRGVIKAKVKIDGKIWTIYINHLSTKEEDRLEQVPFVINLIEKETFKRIVWMGDFNAEPESEPYEKVNGSKTIKFTDTHAYLFKKPEFTGGFDEENDFKPTHRIDYIFCSPDLSPKDGDVHWSLSSDHCAVITEF
ncbi:MAG: endonuclease/exonuclease/phosphatase family protein, partial [Promethearchaeota archaeon]